jgi:Skp family chaperone for outer membrane proteins
MVVRGVRLALVAAMAFAMLASAAPPAPSRTGDAVLDVLILNLEMERKRAVEDAEEFERASERLAHAEADLTAAVARLARLVRDGSPERPALESAADAVDEARARSLVQQERRRSIGESLAEHGRRAAALREEIAKRRDGLRTPSDPVTGRWDVTINPGNLHGTLRLALDGTIVSGDYVLDGGFRGSVRGTFVGDRLSIDRIDSERGFDAKFYGRVTSGAARRIGGTWEATLIAPATGPSAGSWSAQPAREDEGEPR